MLRWLGKLSSPRLGSRSRQRRAFFAPQLIELETRIVPAFLTPQNFVTGTQPVAVAAADVNLDGKLDLVVANKGNSSVSVLLGNGNGTYQAAVNLTTQSMPESVVVADANGDGKPDIVAANYGSDSVSVLLGNGNGTFQTVHNFAAGAKPIFVAVGDVNGDGKLDLAVADYGSSSASVLLGDGTGAFGAGQTFNTGTKPISIATADVNSDGKLDLVAANQSSNNVSVLLGNGTGVFQAAQNFNAGTSPSDVTVADVNGDFRPDAIVADKGSNAVSVLLGNGDGTLQPAQNLATDTGPSAVAVADVNGDGTADLVVANYASSTVSVLLGKGSGAFFTSKSFPTSAGPADVVVADVAGDGRPDLITAGAGSNVVSVLASDSAAPGLGDFQTAKQFTTGVLAYAVVTADLRNNGKIDIVTANRTSNSVTVLLGNGDGTFQPKQDYAAGTSPRGVTVADVNGDGKPDLIYTNYGDAQVSVRLGKGDGTFQAAQSFYSGGKPLSVTATDVNGDGKLDLVVANYFANSCSVLLGNGDGTFQTNRNVAIGAPFSRDVAVADVNADGKPDLLIADEGLNQAIVVLGNGDGTFQAPKDLPTGLSPWKVVAADVNRDGKLDLVLANFSGNSVSVLLGNGDGSFQGFQTFAAGSGPGGVAVADLQGDGKLDIVAANEGGKTLSVILGNGDGTFRGAKSFAAGSYPDAVAIADVNGDGKPDLVAADYTGSTASVLLGLRNSATHFQATAPASTPGGTPFSIAVTAQTPENQSDWLYHGTIHFSSSDPAAVLPANTTFSPTDFGSRNFTLSLNTQGSQTITVTDTVDGTIVSQTTITVTGPGPSQLAFVQQPSNSTAGSAIGPAVAVAVEDKFGNVVSTDNSIVTITIHSGSGSFDGSSTLQATAVNGVATFSNLVLDTAGSYTLAASDGLLPSTNSATFTVNADSPSQLVIRQQPTNAKAGIAINPAVTVAVEDRFANLVTTGSLLVNMAVQTGPGPFDSGSTLQAVVGNGVASFNNLILDSAGSYTLSATAGSLTAANSKGFTVSATTAAKLAFVDQPTNGTAGLILNPAVTVVVEDTFGNLVTGDNSTISLALTGGTASAILHGTMQIQAINGVATFSDLSIDTAGIHYTLTATDGALTAANSALFTIGGAATHLAFIQQASDSLAGVNIDAGLTPSGVQVALEDQDGNIVTTNTSTVTLSLGGGAPGANLNGAVSVAAVRGVATFANLSIDTAATGYLLTATDGTLGSATSSEFAINAGPAAQLVFGRQPSNALAGEGISPAITVMVEDRFGNIVTDNTSMVTMRIQTGSGIFDSRSTVQVATVNGIATFNNLILDTAGSYTIASADGSLTSAGSAPFLINAGSPAELAFGKQPSNGTAGIAINPSVTLTVADKFGNAVNGGASVVTVTIHSGPGSFDNSSVTQATIVNGVATFNSLIFDTAGSYTLTADAGALTSGASAIFVIGAGSATRLAFSQQPSDSTAGAAIGPAVTVRVEDRFGNFATTDTSNIAIAISTGPGTFDVASTLQVTGINGVASFSKLILDTAGSYALSATDGSLTAVSSTGFVISASSPTQLAIKQQPANSVAGLPSSPATTVAVEDQFGNIVSTDASMLTMVIHSGPGGFDSSSTTEVQAVNGLASFSNLILDTAGSYQLSATSGSLNSATSTNVLVSASTPTQLAFGHQPANATAGNALSPAITVSIEDTFGNVVTSAQSMVTIAIHTGPGVFAHGTLQVAVVNGVASFRDLILDTAGSYSLAVAAGPLPSTVSNSFVVDSANPSQLAFTEEPSDSAVGTAIAPAVVVAIEDAFGNVVTANNSTVTMSINSGPGIFDSGSAVQATAVNGVATFSNLILDSAGSYTLAATAGLMPTATSSSFLVGDSTTATRLAFIQQPANSTAGAALSPTVTVAVEDQFGNVLVNDTSLVTIAIHTGPGTFDSSTTQVDAFNGIATFNNLVLDTAGSYTLEAKDGTLAPATSTPLLVSAADASQLIFDKQPSFGTTDAAISPALNIAIEDRFGNLVAVDTSLVTMAVQSGPGKFTGDSTIQVAATNGVASFSNLFLGAAGTYSLTATDGTLTPAHAEITIADSFSEGSPAGFVASLYSIVLDRHADAGGLAYWTQLLAGGNTRSQVAQGFWGSVEHRGQEVEQYYATYLNRSADPGGLAFWKAAFASGMDERGMALAFTNSAEYQAQNSSGLAFVTAVYVDGLGRTPDAAGLAFWESIAGSATGRSTAAMGILTSAEEALHVLDQYYASLLQRKPDNGGQEYWLSILQTGSLTQSAVADEFLASQEFFQKSTTM